MLLAWGMGFQGLKPIEKPAFLALPLLMKELVPIQLHPHLKSYTLNFKKSFFFYRWPQFLFDMLNYNFVCTCLLIQRT